MSCLPSKFEVQELGPHGLKESGEGDLEEENEVMLPIELEKQEIEACGQTLVMTTRKIPGDASPPAPPLLCLRPAGSQK